MSTSVETFTASLLRLRQALAGADPLAAGTDSSGFAAAAASVAESFAIAPGEARLRCLLRALDDAIAGIEVAARLADDLYALDAAGQPVAADAEIGALGDAYNHFAESQPAYQALYHFRNAVAEHLRIEQRPVPPEVAAGDPTAPEADGAPAEETAAPAKGKKRAPKRGA